MLARLYLNLTVRWGYSVRLPKRKFFSQVNLPGVNFNFFLNELQYLWGRSNFSGDHEFYFVKTITD
jgi:hypothetical protein